MADTHANQRFKLYGTEVTKLFNSRYRISVRCELQSHRDEDWYYSNVDEFFKNFGDLYSLPLNVDDADTGWEPRTGEEYPNMRLVQTDFGYIPNKDTPLLTFEYETLTSAFVQEAADKVDYELNGLRRVVRSVIAKDGTSYGKTIKTSTISHDEHGYGAVTLYLASAVEDQKSATEGGYVRILETWVESGILSVSVQNVGGAQRVQVTALNQTTAQVDTALSEVLSTHKLIAQETSNYEGLPTYVYTFEVEDFETRSYIENGLLVLTQTELSTSLFTDGTIGTNTKLDDTTTLYLGREDIDNDGILKRRTRTWVEAGTLSVSTNNLSEGVREVSTTFLVIEGATVGPVTRRSTSNFEGLKTISVTTLQDKNGNSIIGSGEQLANRYDRMVDFTYPGVVSIRQDIVTSTVGTDPNILNFELQSPVQSKVSGTVSVIFQTSSNISSDDFIYNDGSGAASGYWNPTEWAQTYVSGICWRYSAFSKSQTLRGYRTDTNLGGIVTTNPTGSNSFKTNGVSVFQSAGSSYLQTETGANLARLNGVSDSLGFVYVVDGRRIYGSTPFIMQVSGGPENPVGKKYTLDVDVRPAFEDVDGNQYYKKTIVTATV